MSQFGPPPLPVIPSPSPIEVRQPPWSASAIAGFVFSLAGCLGITAVLGFVFGIVGLFRTAGGKRRGKGLAIAALPISVVSAIAFVLLGLSILVLGLAANQLDRLESALKTGSADRVQQISLLREACSNDFNAAVDDRQLAQWLESIETKLGTLTELEVQATTSVRSTGSKRAGTSTFNIPANFVNGKAVVEVSFLMVGVTQLLIDDLSIDSRSPRSEPSPKP